MIFKILAVSTYPILLLVCFLYILKIKNYKQAAINNYKFILFNTSLISAILLLMIFIFFKNEDTIYVFDYAGHWKRALEIRNLFEVNPSSIFAEVYNSMNFSDYSYLPALFNLWGILINKGMGFFVICSYIGFLVPFIVLIQVLYFTFINEHKFLPIIIILSCFPLYINLFFCKIDMGGLFFILMAIMLIIIPKFDEINLKSNLMINLPVFVSIFFRRWYLYTVVFLYVCYFIKYIAFHKDNLLSKESRKDFLKILSSGIVALTVILIFFRPFFMSVVTNNFSEAYEIYNHDGKLLSYFNNISPLIIAIAVIGFFRLFKINKELSLLLLIMSLGPAFLISRIQTMEYHHYYSIIISIIILYSYGILLLIKHRYINLITISLLAFQIFTIFFGTVDTMPLFTNIRKKPEILSYKHDVIELAEFINNETEGFRNVYLSSGSYIFNDDLIRNSFLPEIDNIPNISFATLDLRDGFPKDFKDLEYIITIDPILYTAEEHQHIYHIITDAIINHPSISKIYTPIQTKIIDNLTITIYQKTGEYTDDMKLYFFDQMISYYPDKTEFFKYILD